MATTTRTAGATALLTRLSRRVYMSLDEERVGLPLKILHTVNLVGAAGDEGIAQQDLCISMHLHPNNVVLLLNEIEARGLIERRRDPADRRRHKVYITPAGREATMRGEAAADALEEEVLAALSAAQRRELATLLETALTAPAPPARRRAL